MQDYFYTLADTITPALRGREVFTCSFSGEESDFVRFNRSRVRQAGSVTQRWLSLDLIDGRRHAAASVTLSGELASDRERLSRIISDLRDVIGRRYSEGAVVSCKPDDTLLRANGLMKLYDISQLPVLDGDHIVGIIDESDVLYAVFGSEARWQSQVRQYMTARIKTIDPHTPIEQLMQIFAAGMVAIVTEGDRFLGLITRSDLLNYFRRKI